MTAGLVQPTTMCMAFHSTHSAEGEPTGVSSIITGTYWECWGLIMQHLGLQFGKLVEEGRQPWPQALAFFADFVEPNWCRYFNDRYWGIVEGTVIEANALVTATYEEFMAGRTVASQVAGVLNVMFENTIETNDVQVSPDEIRILRRMGEPPWVGTDPFEDFNG